MVILTMKVAVVVEMSNIQLDSDVEKASRNSIVFKQWIKKITDFATDDIKATWYISSSIKKRIQIVLHDF